MKPYTVASAARFLEVPEHKIRKFITDGTIEVVGKGPYGVFMLSRDDVHQIARIREMGELGRRQKLVLVVGGSILAEQHLALRVSGLTPKPATGILAALAEHDVAGAPIIVATPEAIHAELGVLRTVLGQIHLAVISTTQTAIPWDIELGSCVIEPFEQRRLVTWAWRALACRHEAGSLDL